MACCLCKNIITRQQTKTIIANIKSCPPSPCESIPITSRCDAMAPAIKPVPSNAPIKTVDGTSNKILAISSTMPVPILPQGSTPNFVNNSTDSGCAVNLKYNVCKRMTAAVICNSHENIIFSFNIIHHHIDNENAWCKQEERSVRRLLWRKRGEEK